MATKKIAKTTSKKKTTAREPKTAPAKRHDFKGDVGDHARQGDVLLKRVAKLPADAEKIAGGVIRQGTATGHAHRFPKGVQLHRTKAGVLYAEVLGKAADLVHEEHATIRFTGPAVYQHIQQREFDGEAERAVMD
jgi:hypothetical protein